MNQVVQQAGGPATATIQGGVAQAQQLSVQGQQLYTQANTLAIAGQAVVTKGDAQSVVTLGTLLASSVPPGQAQQILQQVTSSLATGASLGTSVVQAMTRLGLFSSEELAGVSAAAPMVGVAVAALIVLIQQFPASSPTTSDPPIVQELFNVPIPGLAQQQQGGASGEIPLHDPSVWVPSNCSGGTAGIVTGGAMLATWRSDLEMVAQGVPYVPAGGGFQQGVSASDLAFAASCVASVIRGQAEANAAIALAVRWVPFGDSDWRSGVRGPGAAPYADGFQSFPTGTGSGGISIGTPDRPARTLEQNLINLAFAYASWPQAAADRAALQYLLALAWVWNNFPGNTAPLPGWIAYKLGQLEGLVAAGSPVANAGGVAGGAGLMASGALSKTAKVVGVLAGAVAGAVAVHGLLAGVGIAASARTLYADATSLAHRALPRRAPSRAPSRLRRR